MHSLQPPSKFWCVHVQQSCMLSYLTEGSPPPIYCISFSSSWPFSSHWDSACKPDRLPLLVLCGCSPRGGLWLVDPLASAFYTVFFCLLVQTTLCSIQVYNIKFCLQVQQSWWPPCAHCAVHILLFCLSAGPTAHSGSLFSSSFTSVRLASMSSSLLASLAGELGKITQLKNSYVHLWHFSIFGPFYLQHLLLISMVNGY